MSGIERRRGKGYLFVGLAAIGLAAPGSRQAVGAVVVVEDDAVLGVVTDRDLVVRALAHGHVDGRVDSVMTTDVVVVEADGDLRDVIHAFGANAVRRVVLVRDGVVAGVLSVDDLLVDLVELVDLLVRLGLRGRRLDPGGLELGQDPDDLAVLRSPAHGLACDQERLLSGLRGAVALGAGELDESSRQTRQAFRAVLPSSSRRRRLQLARVFQHGEVRDLRRQP